MDKDYKHLHAIQRRLVRAVHNEYGRVRRDLQSSLQFVPEESRAPNIAQNVLRTCLEATLDKMVPYPPEVLADLAIRLASYVISAAKEEDQPALMAIVMQSLPQQHVRRVREGIAIKTVWQDEDGVSRPNM